MKHRSSETEQIRQSPSKQSPSKQSLGKLLVGSAALSFGLALSGCVGGQAPRAASDDPELEMGRGLYVSQCSSCHGLVGGGGRGVRLNQGQVVANHPDIATQIEVVSNGKNAMPAFSGRLSEEEITAVVRYTREVL